MIADTTKRPGGSTADLDDDDAPKEYVRPGDDPMLDGALEQLAKQGGDDPLYWDVRGGAAGQASLKTSPENPDNRSVYVEPKPVPPTRDPTLVRMKVVVSDAALTEEQRQRKAPTVKVPVGRAPADADTSGGPATIEPAPSETAAPVPDAGADPGDRASGRSAPPGVTWRRGRGPLATGGVHAKTPLGLGPVTAVDAGSAELPDEPVAPRAPQPPANARGAPGQAPIAAGDDARSAEHGEATQEAPPESARGPGGTLKMVTGAAASPAGAPPSPWSAAAGRLPPSDGALPSSDAPVAGSTAPAPTQGAPRRAGLWVGLCVIAALALLLWRTRSEPDGLDVHDGAAAAPTSAPPTAIAPLPARVIDEARAIATDSAPGATVAPRASAVATGASQPKASADAAAPATTAKPIPEIF